MDNNSANIKLEAAVNKIILNSFFFNYLKIKKNKIGNNI